MQSLETIQILALVDRELLERRCRALFECFADHAIEAAMALIDPHATMMLGSDTRAMPFYGRHHGAEAIRKALRNIQIEYQVLRQDILDVLLDRDRAVVHRVCRVRHRGTGKVSDVAFCDWVSFREGLVSEIISVADTLPLVELVA